MMPYTLTVYNVATDDAHVVSEQQLLISKEDAIKYLNSVRKELPKYLAAGLVDNRGYNVCDFRE